MLKVEDYGKIRRAAQDGMSIREMARTFGHSRHKIRQVVNEPQPRPYTRRKPAPAPVLGPFHTAIFQGERMTAALLDRLTHRCSIFEMNGESFRFRESMKTRKSKKGD
jgi:hypothetical protein